MIKYVTNIGFIRILGLTTFLAISGLLSACAPVIVGGAAATTTAMAIDRRTVGEQIDDQSIELKVSSRIREILPDNARINNISYAGLVILTGDVPSENIKQLAATKTQEVEKVKRVINEIRVGDVTPLSVRTNDTWLTSKIKTALINAKDVPFRTILVTTERGNVYLLGKVTHDEANRASYVASTVNGVNRVVKAFEIISAASIANETNNSQTTSENHSSEGVQAMPVN